MNSPKESPLEAKKTPISDSPNTPPTHPLPSPKSEQNGEDAQKKLEVSASSTQNARRFEATKLPQNSRQDDSSPSWEKIVALLPPSVAPFMDRSTVRELSKNNADIVVPIEFAQIFDAEKQKLLLDAIRDQFGEQCSLQIRFEHLDNSNSLSAQREQKEKQRQNDIIHSIELSDLFQKAISIFKVDPNGVRFDIK